MNREIVEQSAAAVRRERQERKQFEEDRADENGGRIRFMAYAGGYIMCRKSRAVPFVMHIKEWSILRSYKSAVTGGDHE